MNGEAACMVRDMGCLCVSTVRLARLLASRLLHSAALSATLVSARERRMRLTLLLSL